MRKPRVAHVITAANDGGIEHMVHQICCGLSHEFDFSIYALLEENSREPALKSDGLRFRKLSACNKRGKGSWAPNLVALFDLANELSSWQADIVQVHDFFPGVIGRLSAMAARIPRTIATLHNTYEWLGRPHGLVNRALSLATDRVVGVSNACIDDSKRRDKLPESLYRIIHNGVDQKRFTYRNEGRLRVRRELGLPEDAILIGNVGTISVRKGQDTLLRACSSITKNHPNLHVAIVGSARAHELGVAKNLIAMASTPPLQGRVHFLQDRSDMPDVLSAFDIYSMPSRQEGFGIALAEAMLIGLPIILSDIPAFREVAGNACFGFHPVDDCKTLSMRLDSAIQAHSPANRLGSLDATQRALELFSESAMLDAWACLYRELT